MTHPPDSHRHPLPPGVFFTRKGKTYFLPRQTQADKRMFHAWANARVLAELHDLEEMVAAGQYEPAKFARDSDTVMTWVTTGRYAFHEPAGVERRFTVDGLAAQCWLAMRRHKGQESTSFDAVAAMVAADPAFITEQFKLANVDPTAEGAAPPVKPTEADDRAFYCQALGLSPEQLDKLSDAELRDLYERPHPFQPPAEGESGGNVHPDVVLIEAMRAEGKTTEEIQAEIDARRAERAERRAAAERIEAERFAAAG